MKLNPPVVPWEGCGPWLRPFPGIIITKTRLFKYIENFTTKKWKFSDKKFWYFSLEPRQWGDSNEYPQSMFWAEIRKITYIPKSQFYYTKVGFKGVKII